MEFASPGARVGTASHGGGCQGPGGLQKVLTTRATGQPFAGPSGPSNKLLCTPLCAAPGVAPRGHGADQGHPCPQGQGKAGRPGLTHSSESRTFTQVIDTHTCLASRPRHRTWTRPPSLVPGRCPVLPQSLPHLSVSPAQVAPAAPSLPLTVPQCHFQHLSQSPPVLRDAFGRHSITQSPTLSMVPRRKGSQGRPQQVEARGVSCGDAQERVETGGMTGHLVRRGLGPASRNSFCCSGHFSRDMCDLLVSRLLLKRTEEAEAGLEAAVLARWGEEELAS